MTGSKVSHLEKANLDMWKFNYSGIGESTGDLTFSNWFDDAEAVLNEAYKQENQPVILIASSMGAFISLNLARRKENAEKIKGLFLCAPARDFMRAQIPQLDQIPGDMVPIPGTYEHYSGLPGIPKKFFDDVPSFWFDENQKIDIKCPVQILHPENDELCPIEGSHKLVAAIGDLASLEILPGAKHSMSTADDLEFFEKSLQSFLCQYRDTN